MESSLVNIGNWSNSNILSVAETPKEFSAVILKSPHTESKVIKKVIEELRSEENPHTIKQWMEIISLFIIVLCIGYGFWPKTPGPIEDNQPDMKVKITKAETEDYLYTALEEDELNTVTCEELLKKLRMKTVVEKDAECYKKDFQKYYDLLGILKQKHPESLIVKRCIVEAVLKFMDGAEKIGIKAYARLLQESGDSDYGAKAEYLSKAVECCNEIHKKVTERDIYVLNRFQKSELLMYRWLVENAKKAKGQRIEKILDNRDDVGVCDREDAIKIIREEAWKWSNASELVEQCVEILITNSRGWNAIWFNEVSFYRHTSLRKEVSKIIGGR